MSPYVLENINDIVIRAQEIAPKFANLMVYSFPSEEVDKNSISLHLSFIHGLLAACVINEEVCENDVDNWITNTIEILNGI